MSPKSCKNLILKLIKLNQKYGKTFKTAIQKKQCIRSNVSITIKNDFNIKIDLEILRNHVSQHHHEKTFSIFESTLRFETVFGDDC